MPELKTLPRDIYKLFDDEEHHEPNPENLQALGQNIVDLVRRRLARREDERSPLRFSNLGRPDRQLWYMANKPEAGERMSAKTFFKFLYGDVIEQLLLFLAKEAGHEVTHEQATVEVDGVFGHLDAVIDGVTVDVKSASPYGYKKFEDRSLFDNDPFGYIGQISGYANEVTPETGGAFLAADKVGGGIAVMEVPTTVTNDFKPGPRIEHLKNVIQQKDLPPRCYPLEPEGKSGNLRLGTNCSYCPFKNECYKDANGGRGLRVFNYYNGPKFFADIVVEPKVEEITYNVRTTD